MEEKEVQSNRKRFVQISMEREVEEKEVDLWRISLNLNLELVVEIILAGLTSILTSIFFSTLLATQAWHS